jgi:hypothetical protein
MSEQDESAVPGPAADGLDDLGYEDLRRRAFERAQHRRDIGFFIDLFNHTRAMHAAEAEGGSLGELSGSLIEMVEAAKEAFAARPDEELEPLFRARFVTYLREHPEHA